MKYVIVTGTVTYAIRGRDALRKAGIRATVERNSSGLGRYGCGYGIVVHDDPDNAIEILRKNSVKVIEVNPVK
ncbi:MAG: DUF3343 domain-containing protein [Acutalibacteraceae bacterium]|nr:DUF3343 domain-containing protein [Acutalibacteraceae bacterium]